MRWAGRRIERSGADRLARVRLSGIHLNRGNRMLVYGLNAGRRTQQEQKLVERLYSANQPDAADKINRDALSFLASGIKKVALLRMGLRCGRHADQDWPMNAD